MKGLKEFLQDMSIVMGVWLITKWMGANYEWYVWLVIVLGFITFGIVGGRRGFRAGVRSPKGVVHFKTKAEADAFIAEHTKRGVEVGKRESD